MTERTERLDPTTAISVRTLHPNDVIADETFPEPRRLVYRGTEDGIVSFTDESGERTTDLASVWNARLERGVYALVLGGRASVEPERTE